MTTAAKPVFRELSRAECEAILQRKHVGRLAYAYRNHVDIEPLHYVYADGWIYGRTSHGAKLETTGYVWWPVAFEGDEVEELFRWRSVVVRGGFYTLEPAAAEWEEEEWRRGVELLRRLVPQTFAEGDPVAFRTVVFRIAAQEMTGREAVTGDGGGAPPETP